MAVKEIKISFPEAKMEALEFFLGENNTTVEELMKEQLDKIYEKNVPQQVKKFVDRKIPSQEEPAAQEEPVVQRRTRGGQGRRNGRNHIGETVTEQENTESQQPEADEEQENAQESGMTLGM